LGQGPSTPPVCTSMRGGLCFVCVCVSARVLLWHMMRTQVRVYAVCVCVFVCVCMFVMFVLKQTQTRVSI